MPIRQQRRRNRQFATTMLSVQVRRQNARLVHESQKRREMVLPLTSRDVAHRMYLYNNEPSTILDQGVLEAAASRRCASRSGRRARGSGNTQCAKADEGGSPDAPTSTLRLNDEGATPNVCDVPDSYEAWLNSFQTPAWRDVLGLELYGPEAAEKWFYHAKYSLEGTYTDDCVVDGPADATRDGVSDGSRKQRDGLERGRLNTADAKSSRMPLPSLSHNVTPDGVRAPARRVV